MAPDFGLLPMQGWYGEIEGPAQILAVMPGAKELKSCPECFSEYEDSFTTCPADESLLQTIQKDPLVGTVLANRYVIESVLGRGGMGVVYKARQEMMGKYMAIKMLHSHLVASSDAVMRFRREATTVSQVKHHHIITLYDFGISAQNQPYLVMDYLEGVSLKDIVKDEGPLPFERAGIIYKQVVDALACAHEMNLVHRDLKPENIMLSRYNNEEDWVTLVDFGLSKLKEKKQPEDSYQITKVGDVCGSPPYMSPEQCLSSQVVDPRSDIYSLAIAIYETMTGKLPFNAKSAIEMLDCHLYATPIPFSQTLSDYKVCNELTAVFNKALQKEPDKRHQTVSEFGDEFSEALRRDAVKLKAYRHRLQTSEFMDLASEAEALSKAMFDSGKMQAIQPVGESLEGMQFMQEAAKAQVEPRVSLKPTDRKMLETETGLLEKMQKSLAAMVGKESAQGKHGWKHCPYCDEPSEPGIRFCLNCKRQFISQEEAARLKYAQEADMDNGQRGFSSRAKDATMGGMVNPSTIAVTVFAVLLIGGGLGGYIAYKTGVLGQYIPALALPPSPPPTEADNTADDTTKSVDSDKDASESTPSTKGSASSKNASKRKSQASSLHTRDRNSVSRL